MFPSNLDRIVERLKRRTDPKQKYEQLLAFAKKLEPIPGPIAAKPIAKPAAITEAADTIESIIKFLS